MWEIIIVHVAANSRHKRHRAGPPSHFLFSSILNTDLNNQRCQTCALWLKSAELRLTFGNCLSMWALFTRANNITHISSSAKKKKKNLIELSCLWPCFWGAKIFKPTKSVRENSICVCSFSLQWFTRFMQNQEKHDLKKIRLVFKMYSSFKTHSYKITFYYNCISVKLNIFLVGDGRSSWTGAARMLRKAASL